MAKNLFNRQPEPEPPPVPVKTAVPAEIKTNVPATLDTFMEMGFDPAENLKDERPDIPMIKVLPQAQMFMLPDESKTDKIEGIVLETYRCNAWWDKANPEDGGRPTCSSLDDIKPLASSSKAQSEFCASCPLNQFGTAVEDNGAKGKGKACKNMRRVYILMDGHEFPYLLSLSPTSLTAAKKYLTQLADIKRHVATVVTRITLAKQTNGSRVYSVAEFAVKEQINDIGMLAGIAKLKKQVKEIVRSQAITVAEYETDQTQAGEPF